MCIIMPTTCPHEKNVILNNDIIEWKRHWFILVVGKWILLATLFSSRKKLNKASCICTGRCRPMVFVAILFYFLRSCSIVFYFHLKSQYGRTATNTNKRCATKIYLYRSRLVKMEKDECIVVKGNTNGELLGCFSTHTSL